MSITRPASDLEIIDQLTPRLADHNSGQKIMYRSEHDLLIRRLRAAHHAVRVSFDPPRRTTNGSDFPRFDMALRTLGAATLIVLCMIILWLMLQGIYDSFTASIVMRPAPR